MPYVTMSPNTLANNTKVVAGTHTTVAAVDAITFPQFTTIRAVMVSLGEDASDALYKVSASFTGNVVTLKTWKTDGTDPTPVAATAFSKVINVIVIGE